jgi:hypothetical protein
LWERVLRPFQEEYRSPLLGEPRKSSFPRRVNRYSFWLMNSGKALRAPLLSSITSRSSRSAGFFLGAAALAEGEIKPLIFDSQSFSRPRARKIEFSSSLTPILPFAGEVFGLNPPLLRI